MSKLQEEFECLDNDYRVEKPNHSKTRQGDYVDIQSQIRWVWFQNGAQVQREISAKVDYSI